MPTWRPCWQGQGSHQRQHMDIEIKSQLVCFWFSWGFLFLSTPKSVLMYTFWGGVVGGHLLFLPLKGSSPFNVVTVMALNAVIPLEGWCHSPFWLNQNFIPEIGVTWTYFAKSQICNILSNWYYEQYICTVRPRSECSSFYLILPPSGKRGQQQSGYSIDAKCEKTCFNSFWLCIIFQKACYSPHKKKHTQFLCVKDKWLWDTIDLRGWIKLPYQGTAVILLDFILTVILFIGRSDVTRWASTVPAKLESGVNGVIPPLRPHHTVVSAQGAHVPFHSMSFYK